MDEKKYLSFSPSQQMFHMGALAINPVKHTKNENRYFLPAFLQIYCKFQSKNWAKRFPKEIRRCMSVHIHTYTVYLYMYMYTITCTNSAGGISTPRKSTRVDASITLKDDTMPSLNSQLDGTREISSKHCENREELRKKHVFSLQKTKNLAQSIFRMI